MPSTSRTPRHARKVKSKRLITAEDLLRLTFVGDPQPSPDGSQVVFVCKRVDEKNDYATELWTVASDGRSEPRLFTRGPKDSHPRWSPDADQIAFITKRDDAGHQIAVVPVTGGESRLLTGFPEGDIADFRWSPTGRHLAVLFRERSGEWTKARVDERKETGASDPPLVIDDWFYRFDGDGYFGADRYRLYLVDTESGEHHLLYGKDRLGMDLAYDFSPDGKQLVVITNTDRKALSRPQKSRLVRIDVTSGRVTPIPNIPPGWKLAVAWSPDGTAIAYAGCTGEDAPWGIENAELILVDPVKGGARSITGHTDYCLDAATLSDTGEGFDVNIAWAGNSRHILTSLSWHGEEHLAAIDVTTGRVRTLTSGERVHSMSGVSTDGRTVGLCVSDPVSPSEIHVASLSASGAAKLRPLTNFNHELLNELVLSRPQCHWIESTDDTQVQTWVLPPPAKPGTKRTSTRRHPAVLEIHGGPHAQYGVSFFHEFQLLAAQGYVVVFSNPRGSKGYGRDHTAAIRGAWGSVDWEDIQAVTAFMKGHSGIDAQRMGVMGGSYGGYMTNWAIGHTNDFAAAINDRCVSNMVSMFGTSDIAEPPDNYWRGNTWNRTEDLWDQSPLKHLGRCKTPTLIIHNEGDLRCNIEQAEQVFMVLKHRNIPTRFVRYPRSTSHGMSRIGPPDMRVHRLHQIMDWWKRWLKER